jgi:hypothetical protein
MIKIIIAISILLLGCYGVFGKVIKLRKDVKKGLKTEALDLAFFFPFTGFFLSLLLLFIGGGWLYHLLFS